MNKLVLVGILVVAIIVIGTVAYLTNTTNQATTTTSQTTTTKTTSSKTPVIIYVADAYTKQVCCLAINFSSATGIPVVRPPTSSGSFDLASKIQLPGAQVTVFMPVALEAVKKLGNLNPGWAIAIASDEITIAYTNTSISSNPYAKEALRYAQEAIRTGNYTYWYKFFDILTSGKVKVGIANPNLDPAGFRGWLNLEMAGYVFANDTYYFYNRMLENQGNVTAAHAAELVPELQAGHIQFLYIYKSSAVTKGLEYIRLPPEINLGCSKYASFYSKFNYTVKSGVLKGAPVYLLITVPKNTNNYEEAIAFVTYVVEHPDILKKFGMNVLKPAILFNSTEVPPEIASLLAQGKLVQGGTL